MRPRTILTILILAWMALACFPDLFRSQGWNELAIVAGVARRHCGSWHWLVVLAVILLWSLWPSSSH